MKKGDRFREVGGTEYILAQVEPCKMALISLDDGNRFNEPVKIEDSYVVSEKEWNEITCNESDDFIPILKLESKKEEIKEIGRRAKVHYQKTADGWNKVVKLEGFLTKEEIEGISPEVTRLWNNQNHRMYFYLFQEKEEEVWIGQEPNIIVGQKYDACSFNQAITEMKTCGKVLAKIIKDVKEAEEKEVKVISI